VAGDSAVEFVEVSGLDEVVDGDGGKLEGIVHLSERRGGRGYYIVNWLGAARRSVTGGSTMLDRGLVGL
jgi:hypothetical protein